MVTKKPKGLGRGLDALLGPSLSVGTAEGSAPATPAGTPMMLALHELAPGHQSRLALPMSRGRNHGFQLA